jgi:hypothetical protein
MPSESPTRAFRSAALTFAEVDVDAEFEGVDVFLCLHGVAVRTLVPRSLLQSYFHAGDSPESWVDCFLDHEELIRRATERHFRTRTSIPIILDDKDIERIRGGPPEALAQIV